MFRLCAKKRIEFPLIFLNYFFATLIKERLNRQAQYIILQRQLIRDGPTQPPLILVLNKLYSILKHYYALASKNVKSNGF